MSDIPYKKEINPKVRAIAIVMFLIFIGLIVGLIMSGASVNRASETVGDIDPDAQSLVYANAYSHYISMVVVCINIFLLFGLIWVYIVTFRKTKSRFIFALLFFLGALFIKSVLSIILIHALFIQSAVSQSIIQGALGSSGQGFSVILVFSSMFEIIAMSILLYLSME